MTNLPGILFQRATETPDCVAYRFLTGAEMQSECLTYGQLYLQSANLAALFQQSEDLGSRVLIACKNQKNFVVAFYASMLAGLVAVPSALPHRKTASNRLQLLADDAQVSAMVCDSDALLNYSFEATEKAFRIFDLRSCLIETDQKQLISQLKKVPISEDTICFLQYTSGSTSEPKGVMVSHGNLISNLASIKDAMEVSTASVFLTALPMFHDMGLVGGVLEPMYAGCVGNWMSPAEFVQYPERWLQRIANLGVTICGGPNFMFDLAARSITPEQLVDVNLSKWTVAFCGAEPVRATTLSLFNTTFSPFGFRPSAFFPCYGMAESTLYITGKPINQLISTCSALGTPVVSCGVPNGDTNVLIVNQITRAALEELDVGEIWIAGRSVTQGYWKQPELTRQYFNATLDGQDQKFLRTGDLGYMKNGELYVTGRLKDLIIVYGKKYAPQDIEGEAERSHVGLRESGGAAFSFDFEDSEKLALIFELKREWLRRDSEWSLIVSAVRKAVNATFGLNIDKIMLIKPNTLPRTSSGKVRRSYCRETFLSGEFDHVYSDG